MVHFVKEYLRAGNEIADSVQADDNMTSQKYPFWCFYRFRGA